MLVGKFNAKNSRCLKCTVCEELLYWEINRYILEWLTEGWEPINPHTLTVISLLCGP